MAVLADTTALITQEDPKLTLSNFVNAPIRMPDTVVLVKEGNSASLQTFSRESWTTGR